MQIVKKWTPEDQIAERLFQLEKKGSDLSPIQAAFKNAINRK